MFKYARCQEFCLNDGEWMASQTSWFDGDLSRAIDYVLLAVCLTILAIQCFDLLTGVPEKYPSQHWRLFLISCATSAGIAQRLSPRLAMKRSLRGLSLVSLAALCVLMFR
jgi:hypothetical protein